MPLLPKAEGRSAPNIQSRPAGRTQKEQQNEAGVNPLPNAHYALYVHAPKCIIEPSV